MKKAQPRARRNYLILTTVSIASLLSLGNMVDLVQLHRKVVVDHERRVSVEAELKSSLIDLKANLATEVTAREADAEVVRQNHAVAVVKSATAAKTLQEILNTIDERLASLELDEERRHF